MIPVYLASPFAGDRDRNDAYLRSAIRDCLSRGEAPFAPHAYLPAVLDDAKHGERALGMQAGLAWLRQAARLVAYTDFGWSPGMESERLYAIQRGVVIDERSLGAPWRES